MNAESSKRKASPPVELPADSEVIQTLNDRYAKLNEKWAEAESDLKQFPVPFNVEYQVNDDGQGNLDYLGFAKISGAWRICWGTEYIASPDGISWVPIAECSLAVRISAVKHFLRLREAVKFAAVKTAADVDKAIDALDLAML